MLHGTFFLVYNVYKKRWEKCKIIFVKSYKYYTTYRISFEVISRTFFEKLSKKRMYGMMVEFFDSTFHGGTFNSVVWKNFVELVCRTMMKNVLADKAKS